MKFLWIVLWLTWTATGVPHRRPSYGGVPRTRSHPTYNPNDDIPLDELLANVLAAQRHRKGQEAVLAAEKIVSREEDVVLPTIPKQQTTLPFSSPSSSPPLRAQNQINQEESPSPDAEDFDENELEALTNSMSTSSAHIRKSDAIELPKLPILGEEVGRSESSSLLEGETNVFREIPHVTKKHEAGAPMLVVPPHWRQQQLSEVASQATNPVAQVAQAAQAAAQAAQAAAQAVQAVTQLPQAPSTQQPLLIQAQQEQHLQPTLTTAAPSLNYMPTQPQSAPTPPTMRLQQVQQQPYTNPLPTPPTNPPNLPPPVFYNPTPIPSSNSIPYTQQPQPQVLYEQQSAMSPFPPQQVPSNPYQDPYRRTEYGQYPSSNNINKRDEMYSYYQRALGHPEPILPDLPPPPVVPP